jgi:hypothetical protein
MQVKGDRAGRLMHSTAFDVVCGKNLYTGRTVRIPNGSGSIRGFCRLFLWDSVTGCNLDDDRYYGKKIISETECERNLVTFFQLSGVHSSRHLPTESFCFLMEQIVSVFKRH